MSGTFIGLSVFALVMALFILGLLIDLGCRKLAAWRERHAMRARDYRAAQDRVRTVTTERDLARAQVRLLHAKLARLATPRDNVLYFSSTNLPAFLRKQVGPTHD